MAKELQLSWTKKDFRIDWFSGQGAGGQNRNKNQNCCRITHIETGLVSIGQDHKSRVSNQRDAFNRLVEKLIDHYDLRDETHFAERSDEVIRIYHEPRNIVKDHASGHLQEYKTVVGDADVAEMIEERKKALMSD